MYFHAFLLVDESNLKWMKMGWKTCFWCWKIDGRKRDEYLIKARKDRRTLGEEVKAVT